MPKKPIQNPEDRPLTPKQRAFVAQVLREDDPPSQVDAYRRAYDTEAKPRSQRTEAARVAARPHVARAIEDGRAAQERSMQAAARGRRRWILERLAHEAEAAESDATRVRALEVLGRASGLFDAEAEVTGKRSHSTAEALREELQARLAEALGIVDVEAVALPVATAEEEATAEAEAVAQGQPAGGRAGTAGARTGSA